MKEYKDLCVEFSALVLSEKIRWIADLSPDDIRTFAAGARQAPPDAYIRRWIAFLDEAIARRTAEDRDERLDGLGL